MHIPPPNSSESRDLSRSELDSRDEPPFSGRAMNLQVRSTAEGLENSMQTHRFAKTFTNR